MAVTVNGKSVKTVCDVTCYGRNGFFKLARVEVDKLLGDCDVLLFMFSKRNGKGAPLMIRADKEDMAKLFQAITNAAKVKEDNVGVLTKPVRGPAPKLKAKHRRFTV